MTRYGYLWQDIIEKVLQLEHQQDLEVTKGSVLHPEAIGIAKRWGSYRLPLSDGRSIDIKDYPDSYLVHWDMADPSSPVQHLRHDAPSVWLTLKVIGSTAVGAVIGYRIAKKQSSAESSAGGGALGGGLIGCLVGFAFAAATLPR